MKNLLITTILLFILMCGCNRQLLLRPIPNDPPYQADASILELKVKEDAVRKKVYIASSDTSGYTEDNVKKQLEAADTLFLLGYAPYVPELNYYLHLMHRKTRKELAEMNLDWLKTCNKVLMFPRAGAKSDSVEIATAKEFGIPIYDNILELAKSDGFTTNEVLTILRKKDAK